MKPKMKPLVVLVISIASMAILAWEVIMASPIPQRDRDPVRYTRGLHLYRKNCAVCHGQQGEGAPDWRQRDAQGKFRPPPLNGTGHTWHHPMHVLRDIVRNGTAKFGGNMPAWKGILSDEEINLILFWVQSQWPDEIYRRWYENDRVVRENMRKGK